MTIGGTHKSPVVWDPVNGYDQANFGSPLTGVVDEYAVYKLDDLLTDDTAFDAKVAQIAGHYSIPEPSTMALLASGLAALLAYAWKR